MVKWSEMTRPILHQLTGANLAIILKKKGKKLTLLEIFENISVRINFRTKYIVNEIKDE